MNWGVPSIATSVVGEKLDPQGRAQLPEKRDAVDFR